MRQIRPKEVHVVVSGKPFSSKAATIKIFQGRGDDMPGKQGLPSHARQRRLMSFASVDAGTEHLRVLRGMSEVDQLRART